MRILLSIVLALSVLTRPVAAHDLALVAAVAVVGNEVQVRLIDVYGAAVQGAAVTAGYGLPGKKPSRDNQLRETEPGTFRGPLATGFTDLIEITVVATFVGERFRSSVRTRVGENLAETLLPLAALPHPAQGFDWTVYLYVAALIVLLTATAFALLRRRGSGAAGDGPGEA